MKFNYKIFSWFSLFGLLLNFNLNAQTFEDIGSQFGFLNNITTDKWGSGLSFYDFNQDGWDDLTIALENDSQAIFLITKGIYSYLQLKFTMLVRRRWFCGLISITIMILIF